MNLVRLCFSFLGRINRANYWIGIGIAFGMMWLTLPVVFLLEPEGGYWNRAIGLWVLLWGVSLLAVMQKRLHDLDISGWWLLGFIFLLFLGTSGFGAGFPYSLGPSALKGIGNIAVLVGIIWLGSAKGTKGSNRFGPDPFLD